MWAFHASDIYIDNPLRKVTPVEDTVYKMESAIVDIIHQIYAPRSNITPRRSIRIKPFRLRLSY